MGAPCVPRGPSRVAGAGVILYSPQASRRVPSRAVELETCNGGLIGGEAF